MLLQLLLTKTEEFVGGAPGLQSHAEELTQGNELLQYTVRLVPYEIGRAHV